MKPILFNTDMVRAILDGRKTVTRRVAKGYVLEHLEVDTDGCAIGVYDRFEGFVRPVTDFAPYRSGDILYVRETIYYDAYAAFTQQTFYKADYESKPNWVARTVPAIHMPREVARILLRVTDVRVERLQEIDLKGIRAEGLLTTATFWGDIEIAMLEFVHLWDSTVKPADRDRYGWSANPWVWVIEFERCEKPKEEKQ